MQPSKALVQIQPLGYVTGAMQKCYHISTPFAREVRGRPEMEIPFAMDPVEFWSVSFFSHPLMPVAWAVDQSWGEEMIPSVADATDGWDPWVMPQSTAPGAPFTGTVVEAHLRGAHGCPAQLSPWALGQGGH